MKQAKYLIFALFTAYLILGMAGYYDSKEIQVSHEEVKYETLISEEQARYDALVAEEEKRYTNLNKEK